MRVKTEQTRQRIVDAAYQCFWRSGFTRTSIDDIAERAKLTKKTIYSYYQSKDDLLAAVLVHHNDLAHRRLSHFGEQMPTDPDGMIESSLISSQDGLPRHRAGRDRVSPSSSSSLRIFLGTRPAALRAVTRRRQKSGLPNDLQRPALPVPPNARAK